MAHVDPSVDRQVAQAPGAQTADDARSLSNRQVARRQWPQRSADLLLVSLAFAAYSAAFVLLAPSFGPGVRALGTFPLMLAGWLLGMRGGLAVAILLIPLHLLLLRLGVTGSFPLFTEPGWLAS